MLFAAGTLFLSGCMSTQNSEVVQDDPYYAPMYPEPNLEPLVATGSLFNTQTYQTICMQIEKRCVLAILLRLN